MDYVDDDKPQICFYTPKYGINTSTSVPFDDHSILGSKFLQYKPEKIIFWTDESGLITGIQTWFRSIIDNNLINSGENKGSNSKYKHIFNINPKEYLVKARIWTSTKGVNKIFLKTNLGSEFEIGIDEGNEMPIEYFNYGNKIIISFLGSYNKYLESLGFHIIEKREYLQVMFTGYFELKKVLNNKQKRINYIEKMNKKNFTYEEEAILRTCLLPNAPFNGIMKYCIF